MGTFRQLRRTPGFTAAAILTLALGIATTTAVFAIVDELNFKPIARAHLGGVYGVSMMDVRTGRGGNDVQFADWETLKAYPPAGVAAIAATSNVYPTLIQTPGQADYVLGIDVSAGFADVFNLHAQAGRWISGDDNQGVRGADVVVISDRLWREWFGARPDVAGTVLLTIDRKPHRIIGVAQPGFQGASVDFWRPLGHPPPWPANSLRMRYLKVQPGARVWIRTARGAGLAQTADALSAAIAARVPTEDSPGGTVRLDAAHHELVDQLASGGYKILGFAALVFLAACANLGNMLFARTTEREGELAIRLSLGATRASIFRLVLAETAVICGAAAALGLVIATAALRLFSRAFPALDANYVRRVTLDLSFDWRMFFFAAGAGAFAAVVVGLASLWRSNRVSLLARLASSSQAVVARTEGRTIRTLLVSVQITAAVLLLIASSIFLANTGKELDDRLLFETGQLVAARIRLPFEYNGSRGAHFFDQVLTKVRALDGVTSASLAAALPGGSGPRPRGGFGALAAAAPPRGWSGQPRRLDGSWILASPGFIDTLGLTVTRGRDLWPADDAGSAAVALISDTAAKGLWPNDDPIGKGLICCGNVHPKTVVGVVSDPVGSTDASPLTSPGNYAFVPAAQDYESSMLIVVRSATPLAQVDPLRRAIVAVDDSVPVFNAGPADVMQFAGPTAERAARLLAGTLAAITLAIAVLGVYAVVSYFVARRTREFGLRLALGATRGQIVKLVVDHAIHMVLIGLLPGVLLASLGVRLFEAELENLRAGDVTVWVGTPWFGVPLLMLAAGVVAAYIPARRAAMVEPNQALKEL